VAGRKIKTGKEQRRLRTREEGRGEGENRTRDRSDGGVPGQKGT